ncbi:MAG: hypothetical protein AAF903_00600 [Pseudomonadota bacterium]
MPRILLSSALALAAMAAIPLIAPTAAEARPSTKSFTCQGVRQFIRQRGAVVMNHKGPRLYQRFVDNRGQCYNRSDQLERFFVPTRSGQCALRICSQRFKPFD